ncbi:hypothetical protein C8F04DRAFT_1301675 [Mycena alexandri]|uniref:Uncharacterized protein n=1 Tax=Mycena alexandri TaxID=1745969 RepID=A0AAD6WTG3_9AGAR|nr:hypothetical protein C8F04DRAFT_1301675 [Mycena alexandri]
MPRAAPVRRSPRKHKTKKQAEAALGRIDWDADDAAKTYELITQMEVKANRLVLFGKEGTENTSGESKIAACKRIGSVIFPALFATSPNALVKRVKGKMDNLVSIYKKHAKKLQVTGGGLQNDADNDGGDVHEFLECYIPSDGPHHDTSEQAQNLWDEIEEDFPFFPRLHRFLASRSNIVPPMIATGVGPEGRKVVHLQPPTHTKTDLDPNIDPSLQDTPHLRRSLRLQQIRSQNVDNRGQWSLANMGLWSQFAVGFRGSVGDPDSPSSPIEIDSSPLAPVNKNSQGKTAPRPSTFHRAVEDAKTSKPRPSKKSFEESIIDIQT